ncbi:RNA polymerase subunit sigma [Streptomyces solincola]|uniref:RNA polymerase subunit sigma n=1 Tax=Streptomyces solincola TaxID=2100817 RepID=A0A2S9Q050_9ACTN|nr:sigma-70 family RNA polymerase sigma factor [Streptomyces solincola]PRH79987.1 RNA polymerase subunit sigma [Streptomyces solincola]
MSPALSEDVTDDDLTTWALAASRGDADAVDRFIREVHSDVRRYVGRLADDAQTAEDLTQETFLRALTSLHRYEGRAPARLWLLSIARRAVIDSIRSKTSRPRVFDLADWQDVAERTQPTDLPGFDEGVLLRTLIGALPDDRREAFVLTQLLDLSYEEAARAARCPVGTVRSRVFRARAALARSVRHPEGMPTAA